MAPEPGDQVAAAWAGYGRLLASHADRERVIDVLKAAFVQSRLTKDEFEAEVGRAFGSRTYAELAAITHGIPAGPVAARPPHRPTPARNPAAEAVAWGTGALFVALTLVACMFFDPQYFLLVAGIIFGVVFAAGAQMLFSRQQRRTRGQLFS